MPSTDRPGHAVTGRATPLDRIKTPSPAAFWEEYVLPQRPVILTDMFDTSPLRRLDTMERALAELGDLPLRFQTEYQSQTRSLAEFAAIAGGEREGDFAAAAGRLQRELAAETMTLRDYAARAEADPATTRICSEELTHPVIAAGLVVPPHCAYPALDRYDDGLVSKMFYGKRGLAANLHFDGDHRQVLLYQVFGRKRVVLISPFEAPDLPMNCNLSRLQLAELDTDERDALLGGAAAFEGVVGPGETVFIPMLWFHHLDYLDGALSVNFRFCRNRYKRAFADHLIPTRALQRVSAAMPSEAAIEGPARGHYLAILHALAAPAANLRERNARIEAVLGDVGAVLCPARRGRDALRYPAARVMELPAMAVESMHNGRLLHQDRSHRQAHAAHAVADAEALTAWMREVCRRRGLPETETAAVVCAAFGVAQLEAVPAAERAAAATMLDLLPRVG